MLFNVVFLVIMVIAAIWAVVARSMLKAAIGLAIVSAIIAMLMFRLNCMLAGVFELSVCTGLITVIFISTISLTKPMTDKQILELSKDRTKRYGFLPVLVVLGGSLAVGLMNMPIGFSLAKQIAETDARVVLWNLRQLDLIGQIVILLTGGFGVVLLFKEISLDE